MATCAGETAYGYRPGVPPLRENDSNFRAYQNLPGPGERKEKNGGKPARGTALPFCARARGVPSRTTD